MGIFDIFQYIKTWFTGITGFKSLKRKIDECDTMNNNKRVCMDKSYVEVNDEEEEEEINERRIPNVLLKAGSPNMLDGIYLKVNDEEEEDEEIIEPRIRNKLRSDEMQVGGMIKNLGIESSRKEYSFIGYKQWSLGLEREFSRLQISDTPINNSNNKILPKLETII